MEKLRETEEAVPRLRRVLRAGLDDEGVTFTFALASMLMEEAKERGLQTEASAVSLNEYLGIASSAIDLWGTASRARGAEAAARYRQGDPGANAQLLEAGRLSTGFAGYASVGMLCLISRCFEMGEPGRAFEPVWGGGANVSLPDLASQLAQNVRDWNFRQERIELVEAFMQWSNQPPPDQDGLRAFLTATPDPDFRRAYKDLASARWVADPTPANRAALKSLVPLLLADSTTLDATLARLFGLVIKEFSNEQLVEAMNVCAEHFTRNRPWDLPGSRALA